MTNNTMSKKKSDKEVKKSKEEESEEETQEEETTEEETTDGDAETESEESDEGEGKDEGTSTKIDYKAIAEAEREKRKKAEALIAHDKFKKKHSEDKEADEEDADDEDKPITKKDLARVLAATTKRSQEALYADRINDLAEELAESPEEAEAIIATHANRTWSEDVPLKQQLREARAIVNIDRSTSKISEMKRALGSKANRSGGDADTHMDAQVNKSTKLSKSDEQAYTRAGLKLDVKSGLYSRKLPNGKTMFKDPKTKKSWVK